MSAVIPEMISVTSLEELVAAIRAATGDGSTLSAGRQSSASRRICLDAMNQVVDYPARDMTITVRAGISVRTLNEVLQTENQQLPVECGDPEMSVGAFVASNLFGSRRYGFGTLRDYLIGLEAVDGQGRVFHAGGRVVKNVAGYDLCRLMIGSRGRLAMISQLTFKLVPRAPHAAIAQFAWSNPKNAAAALERLNTSATRPMLIDLHAAPERPWMISVGVAGTAASCDWELRCLRDELSGCDEQHELREGNDSCTAYCDEIARAHLPQPNRLVIRTLPSRVILVAQKLLDHGSHVLSHAGNGILLATLPETSSAATLTDAVTPDVADCGGSVAFSDAPTSPFSDPEQRIVAAFDPHGIFRDA